MVSSVVARWVVWIAGWLGKLGGWDSWVAGKAVSDAGVSSRLGRCPLIYILELKRDPLGKRRKAARFTKQSPTPEAS